MHIIIESYLINAFLDTCWTSLSLMRWSFIWKSISARMTSSFADGYDFFLFKVTILQFLQLNFICFGRTSECILEQCTWWPWTSSLSLWRSAPMLEFALNNKVGLMHAQFLNKQIGIQFEYILFRWKDDGRMVPNGWSFSPNDFSVILQIF